MEKSKILVLEDNKIIREGIKTYLEGNDYKVEEVTTIQEFYNQFIDDIELFVLDVNLPDGNAFSIVPKIKELKKPIIFLTVRDEEVDIINGLKIGGDDYITKPFKLGILKARIETVLRRYQNEDDRFIYYGKMVLDTEGTALHIDGNEVELRPKEYLLLETFMRNMGRTLTRDFLMEITWDHYEEFVHDNTLSVTIRRLREKLDIYGSNIKTIRGLGYKFE
ncbi:response regulator transcription factor [Irregularibacter muris]|uniref:Stage 0 sporulation protein A homolog n=1 Tax=Irregularibacter muris TaxID=1796619 RepID=A0AAE3L0C3_9FIRM|nr:response regulator transcription factor [Irregularibacter muris]MCR1900106.1 response regulator transcription factor [Irregularibacter muris]